MATFVYGTKEIEYEIQRGKRKNVSIVVEPKKAVLLKVPEQITEDDIQKVLAKKSYWIVQQQFLMKDIEVQKSDKDYINGECFLYLGRRYMLQIVEDLAAEKPLVKLYRGKFVVTYNKRSQDDIKSAIIRWYREHAQLVIERRIEYYLRFFEQKRGKIIIKEQEKRWASCNKQGDLMFNWKIVMAPANVIDYVIVHEMCHLICLNHSKEFWEELGRVLPDYMERKNWLMNHGVELDL